MAAIIEPKDFIKESSSVINAELVKEVRGFLQDVSTIVDKISSMRGAPTRTTTGMRGSPQSIPSHKEEGQKALPAPPAPVPEAQAPPMEAAPMKPNVEKIKQFLRELIEQKAVKIPAEIQEKPLKELVGERFKEFSFVYKHPMVGAVQITSDLLIDTIADEFAKIMPKLYGD